MAPRIPGWPGRSHPTLDLPLGEQSSVRRAQVLATIADSRHTPLRGRLDRGLTSPGGLAMQVDPGDLLSDAAAVAPLGLGTQTTGKDWTLGAEGSPRRIIPPPRSARR